MSERGPKGIPTSMPDRRRLEELEEKLGQYKTPRTSEKRRWGALGTTWRVAAGLAVLYLLGGSTVARPDDNSTDPKIIVTNGYIDPEQGHELCTPISMMEALSDPAGLNRREHRLVDTVVVNEGDVIIDGLSGNNTTDNWREVFDDSASMLLAAESIDSKIPDEVPQITGSDNYKFTIRELVDVCFNKDVLAARNTGGSDTRIKEYLEDSRFMKDELATFIEEYPRVRVRTKNELKKAINEYFEIRKQQYLEAGVPIEGFKKFIDVYNAEDKQK